MSEKRTITKEQLPEHNRERDALPETGTPAGVVWRSSTSPPPGAKSGGATGYENSGSGRRQRTEETPPRPPTEGEREALRAAWSGPAQPPGDLSEESQYEERRDAVAGAQQETAAERRLRHYDQGVERPGEANHGK